jgi:hypothetical protein
VTATPYASLDCKGPAGQTVSETFSIYGCTFGVTVETTNKTSSSYCTVLKKTNDNIVREIPASNIIFSFVGYCDFAIEEVTYNIRDAKTNRTVLSTTQQTTPYYLFGTSGSKPKSGSIKPGNYSLEVLINGIQHPPISFRAANITTCSQL